MSRRYEFTIARSEKDERFYVGTDHGNGEMTMTSPRGRASLAFAGALCDSIWLGICRMVDPKHVLQWPATPYSKRSLLPKARRLHS